MDGKVQSLTVLPILRIQTKTPGPTLWKQMFSISIGKQELEADISAA
jgi:hypothetical protein